MRRVRHRNTWRQFGTITRLRVPSTRFGRDKSRSPLIKLGAGRICGRANYGAQSRGSLTHEALTIFTWPDGRRTCQHLVPAGNPTRPRPHQNSASIRKTPCLEPMKIRQGSHTWNRCATRAQGAASGRFGFASRLGRENVRRHFPPDDGRRSGSC